MTKKYIIRDEGIFPLKKTFGDCIDNRVLIDAQSNFKNGFVDILSKYIPNDVEILVDTLQSQISRFYLEFGYSKTISLDSMFEGTYNIRMSRLFKSKVQDEFLSIISDLDISIEEQINLIPSGHYVLVDDDSVAIKTINDIIDSLEDGQILQDEIAKNKYCKTNSMMNLVSKLRKDITIDRVYALSSLCKNNTYDTVDLRDFMFGVYSSGLKVKFENGDVLRVPYIQPFTELKYRAKLINCDLVQFSKEICKLNYEFFSSLGKSVKLAQMSEDFQRLMKMNNIYINCSMTDVCLQLEELIDRL